MNRRAFLGNVAAGGGALLVPGALAQLLTGCATTGPVVTNVIEAALPAITVAATVATGVALDFGVQQASTRTRLANEMYEAASAIYSLTAGSFPTPAQLASTIAAFGGSSALQSYTTFSSAISALYASWYPSIDTGDAATATALLNAIASGIESATAAYVATPAPTMAALKA